MVRTKSRMIYPRNFEEKIGFTTIRSLIGRYILCDLGKKYLDELTFLSDTAEVQIRLNEMNELANLLRSGLSFPQQDYLDPTAELIRLSTPGTYIEPEPLADLRISLNTIIEIKNFLEKQDKEKVKHLLSIAVQAYVDHEILREIDRIIDARGIIKDNATAKLKEIRNSLTRKHNESGAKMARIFAEVKKEGLTSEDLEIAIRNGRQVIPIPAAYKRKIKGFIHDESATGQTVFIEPAEIFEINNEIRELEGAEFREIIRILTAFADFIRPHIETLLLAYRTLGHFDFIRAKAKFALEINARLPFLKNEAMIDWKNARHPLLFLSLQSQKKQVVPLDLCLNRQQRILMISGPNAGGKSVALKTTGLLQYMLQCGLMIPVDENSTSGIFNNIFIDIGDEQSLEHDLSTYTSHLKNLKHFIENANYQTLILIDEFGTGTEPQLGGAIAEAALEDFSEKKCLGVITTHYANLKDAARRTEGIVNGAMLFDPETLSPLFMLRTGNPGSSYAFEIAEKIGFPQYLLERAATRLNRSAIDYDKLLQELEVEKAALLEKKTGMRIADEFLNEMVAKYTNLNNELKVEKGKIIRQAREEALHILERSNKLVENTIREIKASNAEKEQVTQLRKTVQKEQQELEKFLEEPVTEIATSETDLPDSPPVLVLGNWVRIKDQQISGKIIEVREQEVLIEAGQMILHVRSDKLVAAKAPTKKEIRQSDSHTSYSAYQNIHDRSANFKLSIDLRGKKAEEALDIVRRHVDDAVLLSIREFTIIHGKGDGILRKVLRDYLKSIPEVKALTEGHPDRGGSGMTVVTFRY